jgi:DNA-3-methyladenine glycosylase II
VSARPDYWAKACEELSAADPVMAGIIGANPQAALASRGDPFVTLLRSIIGQQISVKAADAVWGRFSAELGELSPSRVMAARHEGLRAAGLSGRKVEYVKDLARRFDSEEIDPTRWPTLADDEVIKELVATRGIGVWTAEMLLIFNLMRPDVCPLDDLGLQRAMRLHYGDRGELGGRAKLREVAEQWRPWRTVATWYLWRSLDPVPVEY